MSVYAGPEIVTNGLVLNIDARSTQSYSSGTTWTDLSSVKSPVSLQNSGAGTVSFTDGYANFAAVDATGTVGYYLINNSAVSSLTTSITLECCFYATTLYTSSGLANARPISPRTTETTQPIGFSMTSSAFNYEINTSTGWNTGTVSNAAAGVNKWVHVMQTTDDANKLFKTYVNGEQVASVTYTGTPNTGNGLLIGRGFYGGILNYAGRVALVRYYSTVLDANQVKQNFYAIKGRFGL
jgi:hypothetical protein